MSLNETLYHVSEHLGLSPTKCQTMDQFAAILQWPGDGFHESQGDGGVHAECGPDIGNN